MAQNIKLKRSSVPGKVPTTAQLDAGEIAINTADGKLYFERDDSTIQTIVTTNSNTTGSINIIGAITGSTLQVAGINYPTTDGTAAQAIITDGAGNLSFGSVAAATAANTVITVKNVSGGTIEKGTPLYVTGSGTAGNIAGVWPADAGNRLRMPALLIAGEQLLDGAEGLGLLDGYISGVDTSAFASGDEVFVAVGGGYTNVPPTGSGVLIQKLGNVEKVHPTNGSGVINGPNAARSLPNWETGRVMVGSPTYPVTSSFTYFDEANSRLGINTTAPSYAFDVNAANIRVGVHTIGIAGSAVTSSLAIGQDALGSYSGTSGNTAIGWKALSLVTGGPNDAIGAEAMRYSIGATYNTAIGVAAGYRSQGTQNTFIGQFSGPYYYDLTEGFNTFIGPLVGIFSSGSARQNTGIGASALYNFRTANSNTAIGSAAGFELTTGGFNTFLGDQAGRGVTTGAKNTVIGRVAGLSPTLTKSIIIGDGDGTIRLRYDNTTDNTFISSSLTVSGFISASGLIYAPNIGAGVDNSVVILDSDGTLRTDEIDSRVWGSTLTDGSGTANYISKWSDANTLTDSIIYDSGTGVGIGTTVTSRNLDIESSAGTSVGIQLNSTATGGRSYSFFSTNNSSGIGGGKFGIYDDTAQQSRITVISDGNVGIGNTTPPEKLTVEGNISSSGDLYVGNDGSLGTIWFGRTAGTVAKITGATTLDFYSDDTVRFIESDASTTKIVAGLNNGTFNINTTGEYNANIKLFVNGATRFNGDSTVTGNLTVDGIVTAQEFHTTFVSASIVYSSGSTKFGDTSDDLHSFTGSVDIAAAANNGIRIAAGNALIGGGASGGDAQLIYWSGDIAYYGRSSLGGSVTQHEFRTGGTTRLTVSSSGYVGIGTTNPSARFVVQGSAGNLYIDDLGAGYNYYDASNVHNFRNTAGVSRLFIDASGGNVGIGNTTPPQKLTVQGNISGSGRLYVGTVDNAATDTDKFLVLNGQEVEYRTGAQVLSDIGAQASGNYVTDAGGAAGQVGVWSSATAMSGSNQLYWDGSKLGINTASPSTTLDVVGAGTTSVDLAHFANSNQTAKILLSLDGVGSSLISMLDASNNEDIRLSTQGSSWFNAGNVGIGNTTPAEKLTVEGNISASGHLDVDGNITGSNAYLTGYLGIGGPSSTYRIDSRGAIRILDNSADPELNFSDNTNSNWALKLERATDSFYIRQNSPGGAGTAIYITGSNGNVGIGTTLPGYKLDVALASASDRFNITRGGAQKAYITGDGAGVFYANLVSYGNSLSGGGGIFQYGGGYGTQTVAHRFKHLTGTFTGTSGDQTMVEILPSINQSSTAGYTGLKVNVTETALGSGTNNLLDLQVGSISKFAVSNTGNVTLGGDLTVSGTVTAQEFHTTFVSASIIYSSGSTKFGDTVDDIHSFTGSLKVQGGITGSLFGTASVALSAPNLYNTDGLLTGNRTIDADGNNITFVVDTGNDFTISSAAGGTVAIDGLTSGTRSHLVGIDTGNGKLYTMTTSSIQNVVSASYASTAGTTNSATGGNNFIGTGTTYLDYLDLGSSIASGASVTSASGSVIADGASNAAVIKVDVNSYEAMFIDYILYDFPKNNKRAGNLRINWNPAGEIVFDETSTRDIGDTSGFIFSVDNDTANATLQATNNTGQDMYLVYEYKLLYIV